LPAHEKLDEMVETGHGNGNVLGFLRDEELVGDYDSYRWSLFMYGRIVMVGFDLSLPSERWSRYTVALTSNTLWFLQTMDDLSWIALMTEGSAQ